MRRYRDGDYPPIWLICIYIIIAISGIIQLIRSEHMFIRVTSIVVILCGAWVTVLMVYRRFSMSEEKNRSSES